MIYKIPDRKIVSDFLPSLAGKYGFDVVEEIDLWLANPGMASDDCKICLGKDITIILSPCDFKTVASLYLNARKANRGNLNSVAIKLKINGKDQHLNRYLSGAPDDAIVTFRNGNDLDYRRENLLITDKRRKVKAQGCTSCYLGVNITPAHKWNARIYSNGQTYYLGTFAKEHEAARAYDKQARRLFGPAARLNFPDAGERPALVAVA